LTRLASVVVAIIVVFVSSPAAAQDPAAAQGMALTVSAPSAAVRKSPSVASPVVGQAPRGAVLDVTRDVGSWVKVTWPDAPDGVGYVHQSMGTLSNRPSREQRLAVAAASLPPPEPADVPASASQANNASAMRTVYVPPPTHRLGLGGQLSAATPGIGFSSRIWSRNRFGVQVDLSRSRMSNDFSENRVRSTEFVPSFIYSLPDYVSESFWLRPYVGGGVAMIRSKLYGGVPEGALSESDSTWGYRAFGGAEVTVPGVPRLAISADVGYQWAHVLFDGFDPAGPRLSVSAHWYVK
jgi:opacity protein-like surface antigen